MLSIRRKEREARVKGAILRSLYEENLKMVGKGPLPSARKQIFISTRSILFLSTLLLVVFGQWGYLNLPLFPEREITASLLTQRPSPRPAAQQTIDPADVRAFLNGTGTPLSRMFGLEVKTIMIDPGHGGSDPGTVGRMGTKEKDITLDIARRLKEKLGRYRSYRVLMTREDDVSVALNKRVEMARTSGADLFVSIHLNYLPAKPINIIETYYFGPSGDAKTRELAEKENAGSRYGLSDFRKMLEKLGETMKLQESRQLASAIQENLFVNIKKLEGNVQDFGVKRAPFVVLLGVDVPAVLAEVACLSNGREERELNTERYRESIANYLEAGILNYLNKGEIQHEARRQTEE